MNTAGFNLSVAGPDRFGILLAEADDRFGSILSSPAFVRVSRPPVGPMVFPWLVIGVAAAIVLVLIVRGEWRRDAGAARLDRRQLFRLAWVPGGIVFFILASDLLGFVPASGAMLLVLMLVLGVRPVAAAAITAVIVPAVYQMFAVQLGVPLPWGLLGW